MNIELTGKTALVTGSTQGIGLAIAEQLARSGARVAVNGRTSARVDEAVAKLGEFDVLGVAADVSTEEGTAELLRQLPDVDILVNNLGIFGAVPPMEITDEQWHAGLDTYLMNVIRATRLVAPIMQAQKGGVVINISTAWAFEPSAMFPTSAVFRAGLAAYTKIFADTYAPDNVRMNNVLPGWIDSLPATDERRQGVPMGRYGRSEEIAATVAFLASEGAGYITGQNIRVDGGVTRSV